MQSDQTTPPKSVAVDALKSEWAGICDAMNRGTYRGTEAEALARIEAIKALIAEVAALIAEAEARVMRIAAGLFPGGYSNNFARITEAVASSALIRAAKGETA